MKTLDLVRHFPVTWKMVRRHRVPRGWLGEPFPIVFDPGGGVYGEQWNEFDQNGILCKGYNPVSIAQYGLHCHTLFTAGDESARDPFLLHAQYLRDRQDADGMYRYSFAHAPYGLKPGWISSLAQAEAASLLFRAYACSKDESFVDAALRALAPFTRDINAGGVTFFQGNDVFFEECPGCPTHIFPGHLVSAFALWEADRYGFASNELRDLHESSVQTLLRWLPLYDADGWSYYQLAVRNGRRHYAAITYHQMNINLLRIYAVMTQRAEFARMSAAWREGLDRWDVRARVWRDSAAWLCERAGEKLRHAGTQAWEPMAVPIQC
jgi:hypothetical protein